MSSEIDGEALIEALKQQQEQSVIFKGVEGVQKTKAGRAADYGAEISAFEMTPTQLKETLTYPFGWGPTEWGPIPFLPDSDVLVQRIEKQWGDLTRYRSPFSSFPFQNVPSCRGLSTAANGNALISGLQLGNVWIGVQPLLGVEGDPMRLLFERDLTPHPQYCAFYKWLQEDFQADVVLHFGMHGTVEWLPGSPLGNTGLSWSDVLLGNMPNVYIYACNNPSESLIAKRRGYGTILSHNVPPYGRAGLYKQLAELKGLLDEARELKETGTGLREAIVNLLETSGLNEDCPFQSSDPNFEMKLETVDAIEEDAFQNYLSQLYQYLMVSKEICSHFVTLFCRFWRIDCIQKVCTFWVPFRKQNPSFAI